MSEWNQHVVEEFRDNEGKVGGVFDGAPLLLLHHTGAKSGTERVSPLMYQAVDGAYGIFASKGGADVNPGWYHNLLAHPDTVIEVEAETIPVMARVIDGPEYDRIWAKQKQERPQFAGYESKTARARIPVVVLERI